MTVAEIIGGIVVLVACVLILILTLAQHTKGQGLSGVLSGGAQMGGGARVRQEDVWLARLTKYAGIVLLVVTLVACVISVRFS